MKHPIPTQQEAEFRIEQLFFSTTDPKGVIQTSNSVFQQISGYSKKELIGSPHNIIRHPDMPKAVFKLLWDNIQIGQPIFAYVKNMARDGSFYWVFTSVFPIKEGYLSIRLKPSSKLQPIVQQLYEKMLADEKKGGIPAAVTLLAQSLRELGFSDYKSFMVSALITEIENRDVLLAEQAKQPSPTFEISTDHSQHKDLQNKLLLWGEKVLSYEAKFETVFPILKEFKSMHGTLTGALVKILRSFTKLRTLSVNLSLAATQIGKEAATLNAIAESFQKISSEIHLQLEQFKKTTQKIQVQLLDTELQIGSQRVQMEMMCFFLKETLRRLNGSEPISDDELPEIFSNLTLLSNLSQTSLTEVIQKMQDLKSTLFKFSKESLELDAAVTGLELVRNTAKIEVTQIEQFAHLVTPYIEEMQRFIDTIRSPMRELSSCSESLVSQISHLGDSLNQMSLEADQISMTLKKIQSNETTSTGNRSIEASRTSLAQAS